MSRKPTSSVDPAGPLAEAMALLSGRGFHAAVSEIQRLLVERLQFREERDRLAAENIRLRQAINPREGYDPSGGP